MPIANVVTRNFFRLVRSGALNENVELEPMSAFKWRQLAQLATVQDVATAVCRGVKNQQFEHCFNMPQEVRQAVYDNAEKSTSHSVAAELGNGILAKRLAKIKAQERKADDYSKESLDVFLYIVANCRATLVGGVSLRLVIRLGNYLRINHDKIDFAKVQRWLRQVQMQKVAKLVGSVLVEHLGFTMHEVPFVKKLDTKASAKLMRDITHGGERQRSGLAYFEYAMLENTSIIWGDIKRRLDNIEE